MSGNGLWGGVGEWPGIGGPSSLRRATAWLRIGAVLYPQPERCTSEEIEMSDGVVTRSVLIAAAAEDVWDALVDPSRLEDWFADEVDGGAGDLVPETEVVFRWDDGTERVGVVGEVDAPRRLAFRWAELGGEETEVAFELAQEAAGTRVTVVETGLTGGWAPRMTALGLAACAVMA
jgi:uncharacterized protein YndB with AHSA1/START domain